MHEDLPHRTALEGPPRPVRCDVPAEVIARYRDGLERWDITADPTPVPRDEIERTRRLALAACAAPERPGGGPSSKTPPPGATQIQEFLARSRS